MIIRLLRIGNAKNSTAGHIRIDDQFECFTLEDEYREVKIEGKTRIKAGKYDVIFREEPSPKTTQYRNRFDWFTWHLMIKNVPGFKYVYIHVGNDDDDTRGCILVGSGIEKKPNGDFLLSRSVDAYRDLYARVKSILKTGERVQIEITVL